MYVCMYVCVCVCMYVCMYVSVCVRACTHTVCFLVNLLPSCARPVSFELSQRRLQTQVHKQCKSVNSEKQIIISIIIIIVIILGSNEPQNQGSKDLKSKDL